MADRELNIVFRVTKEAAARQAQQFHQDERGRIRETSAAQKKAESQAISLLKTRVALSKQFFKQETDSLKAELKTRIALSKQFFGEQAAERKKADDRASAMLRTRTALSRQFFKQETDNLKAELSEQVAARKKADSQAAAMLRTRMSLSRQFFKQEADDQKEREAQDSRLKRGRARALIQHVRDTEAALREEVKADEEAIRAQLDNEKGLAGARKDVRLKTLRETIEATRKAVNEAAETEKNAAASGQAAIDSNRKIARVRREADEKDSLRKFVSNQGFAEERVRKEAAKTGVVQRDESKKTRSALQEQQGEIMRISTAYTTMRFAAIVGQDISAAMKAASESIRESRDFIEGMVESTARLRKEMAEIHAMSGRPQSDASTADDLMAFARNSVTPQQGIAAQKEFIAQAQGMIEPENLAPGQKASSYRMTRGQAKELSDFAMSVAASQGMEPASAELLMSTLISKATVDRDGKIDAGAVKQQFARNMGLFQAERGHTAQDVRQFAEAAQKNAATPADIDRLAVLHAAQSQIGPGKSRVHLDALSRALQQLDDEKRDELGITPGMTEEQQLNAATAAIPRLAKSEFGGDEGRAIRRYFNNQQEYDAFKAHLNEGVRGGFYDKVRGDQGAGGTAASQQRIDDFRKSQTGVESRQESETAAAKARRSAHFRNLVESRREAGISVVESGKAEAAEGWFSAMVTQAGQAFGRGNPFEQETEKLNLKRITDGLMRYEAGREWLAKHGPLTDRSGEDLKAQAANLWISLRDQAAARTARGLPAEPPTGATIQAQARQAASASLQASGQLTADTPLEQRRAMVDREANAQMAARLPAGAGRPGRVRDEHSVQVAGQEVARVGGVRPQTPAEHGRAMADTLASEAQAAERPAAGRRHVVLPPGLMDGNGLGGGGGGRRGLRVVLPPGLMNRAAGVGGGSMGRIGGLGHQLTTRQRLARIAAGRHQGLRGVTTTGLGRDPAGDADARAADPAFAAAQAHIDANRQYLDNRYAATVVGHAAPPKPVYPDYSPRFSMGAAMGVVSGQQATARSAEAERMGARQARGGPKPLASHAMTQAELGQHTTGGVMMGHLRGAGAAGDNLAGSVGATLGKAAEKLMGAVRMMNPAVPPALPGRPNVQRN